MTTQDLPSSEEQLFNIKFYPILDEKDGVEKAGSESLLKELLFMASNHILPEKLNEIEKFHKKKDWNKVQKIAHKLKGGSMLCGTIRLTLACQYLEKYWKAGHRQLLENLYQQLLEVLEETEKEIQLWLKSR